MKSSGRSLSGATGCFGARMPELMTGAVMNETVNMRRAFIRALYPSIRRVISHGVASPMSAPVMLSSP